MQNDTIIVSLGGSLVVPDTIDTQFLKQFKSIILRHVQKGKRFAIIVGGGKIAREYQKAAREIHTAREKETDWLGIRATHLNAHLLRGMFGKYAPREIITDPRKDVRRMRERILIAGGWKPGFSTDYDAVLIAEQLKAKQLLNLSNINYVYDKDPKKYKDAHIIREISWKAFRNLLPKRWHPGSNVPFDPIASKLAERLKIKVVIMNGGLLQNFENYLSQRHFKGTIIS